MNTIYVIGRMRGLHRFNHAAFAEAAKELAGIGWNVVNPHDEDLKAGFDVMTYNPAKFGLTWDDPPPESMFDMDACRIRNTLNVDAADAVFVLKGGLGANGIDEFEAAVLKGKRIYRQDNGYPYPDRNERERPGKTIRAAEAVEGPGFSSNAENGPIPAKEWPRGLVLDEAKRLTCGDRNASYGPPTQDFARTAAMWTALMSGKLREGADITPSDVAWMMILLKASRAQHSGKRDNYVDAAGYAACGWECEEEWA